MRKLWRRMVQIGECGVADASLQPIEGELADLELEAVAAAGGSGRGGMGGSGGGTMSGVEWQPPRMK